MTRQRSSDGFVYFARRESGGPVKIGSTGDVRQRMVGLAAKSGEPIIVLGCAPGGVDLERVLQARFSHLRITPAGEWFRPADDILEFAARFGAVGSAGCGVTVPCQIRPEPTPAQRLVRLLDMLPGTTKEQAAGLGVPFHRLRHWILRAAYDGSGREWTRYEREPTEADVERMRQLVLKHRAEIDADPQVWL